jgi:cysteine desulfuration protein SufE
MADIDEIIGNFAVLDDWDDRYRYLIELGRELPPLAEAAHSDANKVQGCASQVWLDTTVRPNGAGGPVLTFAGDSDAHIVRGLIAILFAVYSGKSAREILNTDAVKLFEGMGLREHLTPQRSNGFRSMVERIRSDARATLAAALSGATRPSVLGPLGQLSGSLHGPRNDWPAPERQRPYQILKAPDERLLIPCQRKARANEPRRN